MQLVGLQLLVGETSAHPWIKIWVIGAARPCSERKTSLICFSTRIRFRHSHFVVTAQTTCSKEIAHADLLTSCYRVHSRAYLITVATDTGCYRTQPVLFDYQGKRLTYSYHVTIILWSLICVDGPTPVLIRSHFTFQTVVFTLLTGVYL